MLSTGLLWRWRRVGECKGGLEPLSTSPRPAHQPPRPHLPGGDDPDGHLAHRRHEQHCPRPEDPHLFRSRAPPQRGKARGAPRHLQGQGTGRGGAITAEWGSLASVLCQPRSAGLLVVPKQVCKPLPKRVGCHQLRREPVGSQPCGDSPAQLSALPTGPCHGLSSEHRVNPSHASPTASRSPEQVPAPPLPPRVAAGVTGCQMLLPCPPSHSRLCPSSPSNRLRGQRAQHPCPPPHTHVRAILCPDTPQQAGGGGTGVLKAKLPHTQAAALALWHCHSACSS